MDAGISKTGTHAGRVALRARGDASKPNQDYGASCMVEAWWGAVLAPNTLELRQWKDIISCLRTVEECQKSIRAKDE